MKTVKFFLASEAAREMNCSATTVREMARRGVIPVSRTATGTRTFAAGDVRRLKAQRSENPRKRT